MRLMHVLGFAHLIYAKLKHKESKWKHENESTKQQNEIISRC